MPKWALIAASLGLLASGTGAAQAQTPWPQRPITFIVSQSAGSSPDVMARLLASRVEKALGQSVIIDNRVGGANVIGAMAAAKAAPDGSVFFFGTSAALANNPFLIKSLPYDPVKDFTPVAFVTRSSQAIVVTKDLPVKTLPELIALDKSKPGALSIAVDGPRYLAGMTAQALNHDAGTQMVLVSFPNIGQGVEDTIAGRTQVGVFSVSIIEPHVRSGDVRALAIASTERSPALPDAAPVAATLPGFDMSGWFMLMAPKGTPAAIVEKLNGAVETALKEPELRATAAKIGFELGSPGDGPPASAAAFLTRELDHWRKITNELGIAPE